MYIPQTHETTTSFFFADDTAAILSYSHSYETSVDNISSGIRIWKIELNDSKYVRVDHGYIPTYSDGKPVPASNYARYF